MTCVAFWFVLISSFCNKGWRGGGESRRNRSVGGGERGEGINIDEREDEGGGSIIKYGRRCALGEWGWEGSWIILTII